MKVLVVDDDLTMMWSLCALLRRWGGEVHSASGALVGVGLAREIAYDLVLLDLHWPERDAIWFLSHARLPLATQVILVGASLDPVALAEARRLGVRTVIEKPFGGDELLQVLDRVVGQPAETMQVAAA